MNLGPHAGFIVAAYILTVAVIAVLIGWVALGHRAQKRQLAKLEAEGTIRRSGAAAGKPA